MLVHAAPSAHPVSVTVGQFPQLVSTRYTAADGLPQAAVEAIRCERGKVFAWAGSRVFVLDGERWRERASDESVPERYLNVPGSPGGVQTLARTRSGELWITTPKGAYRSSAQGWVPIELPRRYVAHQVMPDIDLSIRAVLQDRSGHIWLATDRGAYVTDGAEWWHPLDHRDGMPYILVTCLHMTENGDLWGGTEEGAWRLRNGRWRYFWGKRWLPGNRVYDIASDATGRVWLATSEGVAVIEEKPTTLPDKAAHYERITQARHSRNGWISGCGLLEAGRPEKGIMPHASDNDGLWTAIYVAAESFRYASDRSEESRAFARRSMQALLDLVRLSGYPGFPARAIIRKGERVSGYDPEETVRVPGETDKIWYTSPTHPDYLCKGDTSSDELDGHYFAWFVYHELVADDKEKQEIARVCRAVTDNLLQHEFTLVGHTGRKTRWGVFGPQYLNEDPRWVEERGLNSLELLCYLKVAYHICGDERFAKAYEELIASHHYLINTLLYRRATPWYAVNFSDDELAYCVYYPLLQLERNAERRAVLLQSLATTWKGLSKENRAWYNVQYAALTGESALLDAAVECLQDWPWELIEWEVRNSHRMDVELHHVPWGRPLVTRVLPYSELPVMRWNGNPYAADGSGDGRSEDDAGAWLLAYWMARYHGLIRH